MRVYIMADRQFTGSLLTESLGIDRMSVDNPQEKFSINPRSSDPEDYPEYYKRLIKERICVPEN